MAAFWNIGTITLATNSADVVGQGTNFLGSTARAGDQIESDDGRKATIASINSATSITLDKPWRGAGQDAAAYKIWFTPDDVILEGLGRRALSNLSSGNINALAGLLLEADKGIHATGDGTLATHDLTPKGREIIGAADSAAAQTAIGGSAVGRALFSAADDAAARAGLGATTVGDALFTAADDAAARQAMGAADGTRYGEWARMVNDWNTVLRTGFYQSGPTAANAPSVGTYYMGHVVAHDDTLNYVVQTVQMFTDSLRSERIRTFERRRRAGVWSAWRELSTAPDPIYFLQNIDAAVGAGEVWFYGSFRRHGSAVGVYVPIPTSGVFTRLVVVTGGSPGGAGAAVNFTLQRLFSDTAMVATVASGTNQGESTVPVRFNAGDRMCIKGQSVNGGVGAPTFALTFQPD